MFLKASDIVYKKSYIGFQANSFSKVMYKRKRFGALFLTDGMNKPAILLKLSTLPFRSFSIAPPFSCSCDVTSAVPLHREIQNGVLCNSKLQDRGRCCRGRHQNLFPPVPISPKLRNKWLGKVRRPSSYVASNNSGLCGLHFVDAD